MESNDKIFNERFFNDSNRKSPSFTSISFNLNNDKDSSLNNTFNVPANQFQKNIISGSAFWKQPEKKIVNEERNSSSESDD